MDPTGPERQLPHRLDERVAVELGGGVAVDPVQLEIAGSDQLLLLLGPVDGGDDHDRHAGADPPQRRGDRGQHARIAGEQVPVGAGIGCVGTAGTDQLDAVAGPRGGRPWSGDAGAAVVDEVDRQQARVGVPVTNRVGAHPRPALAWQLRLDLVDRERRFVAGARRR